MFEDSASLLAEPLRVLGAAFIRTTGRPTQIDAPMAVFAIRKHRVGPPLWDAVGAEGCDEAGADLLARHAAANAHSIATCALVQARAIGALAAAGVPALVFKGLPMAVALYGAAKRRHCGDIDILVRPGDYANAAACLGAIGMARQVSYLPKDRPLNGLTAALFRDITLVDDATKRKIELHKTVLFSRQTSDALLSADASMRPRLPARPGDIAAPEIGPALALYLLQHGAISGWFRLKWLLDIARLMTRLDETGAKELADLAELCGSAASAKASLLLMRAAFAQEMPGPLAAWVGEKSGSAAVMRRLRYYAGLINCNAEAEPNPFNSSRMALKSTLLLAEHWSDRAEILLTAPLATGLRHAMRRFASPAAESD